MSNVLIGIVGIMLFVGLALAGASYFGPVMQDSVQEGRASGTLQALSDVSRYVSERNRQEETSTPAAPDASVLVPDYLDQIAKNPVNGATVVLLTAAGQTGGGPAEIVATRFENTRDAMCKFVNRSGGGADAVDVVTALPARRSGCVKLTSGYGPFAAGDYVAFMRIG